MARKTGASAADQPGGSNSVQRLRSTGTSTMPYLIGALFASAVMAWYFFVFVPGQLTYFVGLRFRTLAVASGQIKSKADNLARSLNGAVHPRDELQRPVEAPDPDLRRGYFEALIPDLLGSPEASGLRLSVDDSPNPPITATVAWEDIVRSASIVSAQEFDDLVLANSEGQVVWQREKTTLRIGNLKELLEVEAESGRWFSLSWHVESSRPKEKPRAVPGTAELSVINLGGVSSYAFVQALTLDAKGVTEKSPLYVAGLVPRRVLEREAMHIPVAWVVLFALPVVLLFLAMPFIKLATLTPKERYSFADVALLGLAAVCSVGIGAMLPFGPAAIDSETDRTLVAFANAIEQQFAAETRSVLRLASIIQADEAKLKPAPGTAILKPCLHQIGQDATKSVNRCGLWETLRGLHAGATSSSNDLPDAFELDVVAWVNHDGWQTQKWTAKQVVTTLASHRSFAHYRDLVAGRTWTLADGNPATAFTVEPLRTPTRAQMGTIFGMAASGAQHASDFFILNVTPQSLVSPLVPPGYGFAVLAEDGSVLFHSEEALSLEENYLSEVSNPDAVRGWIETGHSSTWSGDYHGRPHRSHIQKMTQFRGCPWRIVTFQEVEPVLDTQIRQQGAILRLGLMNLAALVGFVGLLLALARFSQGSVRDSLAAATSAASPVGVLLLGVLTVVAVGLLFWTYHPASNRHLDGLYAFFVALPLAAIAIAAATRYAAAALPGSSSHRGNLLEIGLLLLLVGAAPAIGFARIAYRVQDTSTTVHWLELAGQQWNARRAHSDDRISRGAYSAEAREVMQGAEASALSAGRCAPLYSYITTIPRVKLLCDQANTVPDRSASGQEAAGGQEWIRAIFNWAPYLTKEGPTRPPVQWNAASPALRLRPEFAKVTLGADLDNSMGGDLSWLKTLIGLLIVMAAFWSLYWARQRLVIPPFVAMPTLQAQLAHLGAAGSHGICLIAPPRAGKDQAIADAVLAHTGRPPLVRIPLLDAQINQASIGDQVRRVEALIASAPRAPSGQQAPAWIHLSNLESQLATAEARTQVLHLLEKLMDQSTRIGSRVVVVTSSVDPIANFEEIFVDEREQVYDNTMPEALLTRASLVLSRFRRAFLPICPDCAIERWQRWLRYRRAEWRQTLHLELVGFEPLAGIEQELSVAWPHADPSAEQLARAIAAKAQATYELLWASCTRSEKLALIQLAQEGLVNPKCYDVVTSLVAKGLVVAAPRLRVFNYSFRRFLRGIERGHIVSEWERMEGSGLWVTAGRLIGSSMIAGGLFFLLTQDMSVQSLLPIVSGTGIFGLPVVRELVARFSGRTADAPKSA